MKKILLLIALTTALLCPALSYAVTADIIGAPSGLTNQTNPIISVAGDGVVSYQYKLDSGDWSGEIPVGQNIEFSADIDIYGDIFTAGTTDLQEMFDARAGYFDSVTVGNVKVNTPLLFLLNDTRVFLDNENTLYLEGSNIDQLEVHMNSTPGTPAAVINQSFTTNPQYVTYSLSTNTPETDYVRIINSSDSTASFSFNLNNKMFSSDSDLLTAIQAMAPEYPGEPLQRKVWRFIRDNRYHWYPLADYYSFTSWTTSSPALFFNSIGFGFCGNSAQLFCQIMTLFGYQTRIWGLEGHIVSEALINGRWEMYDADLQVYYLSRQGDVAGVEELVADPTLITNPAILVPGALPNAYSQEVADIYSSTGDNVTDTWAYDDIVNSYSLNMQIPPSGILELPAVFGAPVHTTWTDAPYYTNARLTVPRGWSGALDTTLALHSIGYEGPHTLSVIGKDSAGNWQTEPAIATWTTDSWPPVTTPSQPVITDPVTLSANEAATIYYTTDGSTPTTDSPVYTNPIDMGPSPVLKYFGVDLATNFEQVKCYSPITGEVYICNQPPPATDLTVTIDKASPQTIGTLVTFAASATGGSGDYEYAFWLRNPSGKWSLPQGYSSLSNWRWDTTGIDLGEYYLQVWARSAGSTASYDVYKNVACIITPPPATGVTLEADKVSPQDQGAVITFTAAATGGTGSYEYSFRYRNPMTGSWNVGQAYSSNPVWIWNTTVAGGTYTIEVWARSAGSSVSYDVTQSMSYTINVTPATGATLTWDKASPQGQGEVITFTAGATGGTGNYEYYFTYWNPNTGLWYVGQAYGGNPVWIWNTAGADTGTYSIQVWARSVGSPQAYDAWKGVDYTINLPSHTITSSVFSGSGSISCVPSTVFSGGTVVCSLPPTDGFYLGILTDNLADVTSLVANGSYTISNVTSDHTVSATFGSYPVKKTPGSSSAYYFTIQSAYDASSGDDLIQTQTGDISENLLFNLDVAVTLSGGYQSDFSTQNGFTNIHGSLTVSSGSVTIENLVIQ